MSQSEGENYGNDQENGDHDAFNDPKLSVCHSPGPRRSWCRPPTQSHVYIVDKSAKHEHRESDEEPHRKQRVRRWPKGRGNQQKQGTQRPNGLCCNERSGVPNHGPGIQRGLRIAPRHLSREPSRNHSGHPNDNTRQHLEHSTTHADAECLKQPKLGGPQRV
jgi:hypothetical protein